MRKLCCHATPTPPAKTLLYFSFHVSFPSSSIQGLLLGTLRRRGDERELVSWGATALNEGGPVLLSPQRRTVSGMEPLQSGTTESRCSGSGPPPPSHTHTCRQTETHKPWKIWSQVSTTDKTSSLRNSHVQRVWWTQGKVKSEFYIESALKKQN